jgi:hypothetical protein
MAGFKVYFLEHGHLKIGNPQKTPQEYIYK